MKYRIAVCDDDNEFLKMMNKVLENYLIATDYDFEYRLFDKGKNLIGMCEKEEYHIFFLDIEMAPENGIELARLIRKDKRMAYIIFISNYPEYMGESFGVHPYGYLTKDCKKTAIINLLDEIFAEIKEKFAICTFKRTDGIWENVYIKDILYMQVYDAKKECLQVMLKDKNIIIRGTIREWENKLGRYNFVTCYKGVLVNIIHIHFFSGKEITMINGETLPVSRNYEKIIKKIYIEKIIEML